MELAAAFDRLTRRAVALELPVLAAHDLTMWEYVVLSGLVDGPAQTQARLAEAVGRDKTRLIPILDALEARGLVTRAPDPADRRNKTVALTAPAARSGRPWRAPSAWPRRSCSARSTPPSAGVPAAARAPLRGLPTDHHLTGTLESPQPPRRGFPPRR